MLLNPKIYSAHFPTETRLTQNVVLCRRIGKYQIFYGTNLAPHIYVYISTLLLTNAIMINAKRYSPTITFN